MDAPELIVTTIALALAGFPRDAAADPLDADRALVVRSFAVGDEPRGPRAAREPLALATRAEPITDERLAWKSPLFVWIEEGYAFASLELAE